MMQNNSFYRFGLAVGLSLLMTRSSAQERQGMDMVLKDDWRMQSETVVPAAGAAISKAGYATTGWYKVSVPTTIIGGLLANKVYSFDPFYGMNFEKLKDPKLDAPWWFRREFELPAAEKGKDIVLKLHGVNYKANVWLNGVLIADSNRVMNPFRVIELNVTAVARPGAANVAGA